MEHPHFEYAESSGWRLFKVKDKVMNWLLTGRVGSSSKAMAAHLCGYSCEGDYPLDPDDFNRCLLFLQAVPEARPELHRMATVSPVWAALVARWDEIEKSFLDEAGLDWSKGNRASNTYRLMNKIIDGASANKSSTG